ncbi:DEDD exonuclease domain-containing protein [Williamsia maris]|uniref:DNA polymerase-3 subunit epsilon n=1 Tax=Williamsia maris TaxID=72806 RepID=A0ABT1HFI8_9NOCA|nr:DEDD exonuclease domain-containing protein [Williamsia maris]MCP2176999.1 DNA polymerase-3 subunit epsilon [Williamsia maris]
MGLPDHLDLDVHTSTTGPTGTVVPARIDGAADPAALGTQLSFDAIGDAGFDPLLFETTFVIVDLETTGGSAATDRITEIGAVKVRGGEILGELATLVDPGRAIPQHIVALTGITEAMVYRAPRIDEVLPAFLEFAHGCVLVAHNAGFDMSFLRAAAAELGHPWTFRRVLCTVKLARRVLTRDEAPTVKLSALARHFAVATTPTHRALDDARATVEVMHALFERVGNLGVHSYRELIDFLPGLSTAQRAKRQMTDHLPTRPGVYLFRGPSGEVLYVGTAVDLRRRARQYFTGSETRARMREMVTLAVSIDHVECAHRLEAGVRELRLLAAHAPAYNRRSKSPHRGWWVCLTEEPFPRLKVSQNPTTVAVGPIRVRGDAAAVADLIAAVTRLRSCTRRLSSSAAHTCTVTADGRRPVGGCHAASDTPVDAGGYTPAVERAAALMTGGDDGPLRTVLDRLQSLASAEMFETAARLRDRLAVTLAGLERCQRLTALCRISELVAARPDGSGGWELAVIRHGRLASAGVATRGVAPMQVAQSLTLAAETVVPGPGPLRGAAAEEAALVYAWLVTPGSRIVCSTAPFMLPVAAAARWGDWRETVATAHARSRELVALAG